MSGGGGHKMQTSHCWICSKKVLSEDNLIWEIRLVWSSLFFKHIYNWILFKRRHHLLTTSGTILNGTDCLPQNFNSINLRYKVPAEDDGGQQLVRQVLSARQQPWEEEQCHLVVQGGVFCYLGLDGNLWWRREFLTMHQWLWSNKESWWWKTVAWWHIIIYDPICYALNLLWPGVQMAV